MRRNLTAGQKLKSRAKSQKITEEEFQNSQAQIDVENRAAEQQVMQALLQLRSFRNSCTLDNPWLALYSDLPKEIDLTNDLESVVRVIDRIDCSPDHPPVISLLYMNEKESFHQILAPASRGRRTASGKNSAKASAAETSSEDNAGLFESPNASKPQKEN